MKTVDPKILKRANEIDGYLKIAKEISSNITPETLREFLAMVLSTISEAREGIGEYADEKMEEIEESLSYIVEVQKETVAEIEDTNKKTKKSASALLEAAQQVLDQVRDAKSEMENRLDEAIEKAKRECAIDKNGIMEAVEKLIPSPYVLSATEVRDSLAGLEGEERLSINSLKDVDKLEARLVAQLGKGGKKGYMMGGTTGGIKSIKAGSNITISFNGDPSNGNITISATGGGGGGSGTVSSGTQYRLAYYASTGDTVSEADAITAARVLISDANGVPTHSSITTTTLGYLDATSSIQTQLNAKQATITGGASTIVSSDLTASRALIANGSGKVAVSATTDTELGYVSGVTSAIQTQLNTKITASSSDVLTNKTINASNNTISNITVAMFATNVADTDNTLAANSDTRLATQKAVKAYVDNYITGLAWKQAVRAATTANGTLATAYENGDTIDGVVLATGDRILLKNQTSQTENGIYIVQASGAPARSTDGDTGVELVSATVLVKEGTVNADTQWTCTNNDTITIGATNIAFAQISGAGTYTASTGITLTGNAFSVNNATVPYKADNLSVFAATTSAQLAGVINDETGTGVLVFATSPTLTTSLLVAANTFTLGSTTTGLGTIHITSTGVINFGNGNAVITHSSGVVGITTGDLRVTSANVGTNGDSVATLSSTSTYTNKTLTSPKIGTGIYDTNGNELFLMTATASAVNEITYANAATGNDPTFTMSGGDSNVGFKFVPKGTGYVKGVLKRMMIRLVDAATNTATGTSIGGDIRISRNAIIIKNVGAYVDTAGTTGLMTIDINEAGSTIMTTNKVTLDSTEKTSETAATAPGITDTAIAADAIITIDVDGVQTTPAKGLTVWIDYVEN